MGAGSLFSDCSDQSQLLRLNKSLPFPLPLSLCLPLSLSLCLHLCLNSCLYLTLPLNLKLSFCLCLWLCLCLFQGKSQIGWGFVFVFVFASVSVLVFGRRKSSFLLFSDYPDRGQTVDPEAKIPRLILRLDQRASKRTATNDGSVKIPELKQIQPKNFSKSSWRTQVNPAEELQQIQTQKIKQIHA